MPHCACRCRRGNREPPARGTSELETRSPSAFLEQYEARFGQHPLLPTGQAAAGLPSRQVADNLNDLDQIPRCQLRQVRLIPLGPIAFIVAATEHGYTPQPISRLPGNRSQGTKARSQDDSDRTYCHAAD
jgi:hypothetical protein